MKRIVHEQLNDCRIILEHEVGDKKMALVKSWWWPTTKWNGEVHYTMTGASTPIMYALWCHKDKPLEQASAVSMLTPSGRRKSEGSSIKTFLKMTKIIQKVEII
jgi:hypothetical protein